MWKMLNLFFYLFYFIGVLEASAGKELIFLSHLRKHHRSLMLLREVKLFSLLPMESNAPKMQQCFLGTMALFAQIVTFSLLHLWVMG